MSARFLFIAGFAALLLAGCGDDEEEEDVVVGEWMNTTYPCQSTEDLLAALQRDPATGPAFELTAARRQCGAQGKAFDGKAQCTDGKMQVICE